MKIKELIHSLRGKLQFKSRPPIPLNEYDKMKIENLINKELKTNQMKRDSGDNNRDVSAI